MSLIGTHLVAEINRRRLRVAPRTTGIGRQRRRPMPAPPLLPGAGRTGRRPCADAGVADHPLRPPRDRRAERGRALRLDGDRRDPHAAHHDDDRRGEGGGARHRSARREDHRPLRLDVPRGDAQPARRAAQSARRRRLRRPDPGGTRGCGLVGSVGRQRCSARYRRRAGERCAGEPRSPGSGCIRPAGPTHRTCSSPTRSRGSPRCTKPSTATSTSASSSRTTRPPTCTSGTAATCTSHPMRSNR